MKLPNTRTCTITGFLTLIAGLFTFACNDDAASFASESETIDATSAAYEISSGKPPTVNSRFAGTWVGMLPDQSQPTRLVFNLRQTASGDWSGTMDSPDEGIIGVPLSSVSIAGNQLSLKLSNDAGGFSGALSSHGRSLQGTATQGTNSLPLVLYKQPHPLDYRRPQDPVPPLPYRSIDVTFPSASAGVTLAGTLTYRPSRAPVKAVVLVTGSGPQNRNEELVNHRPFLVLADALTRANIAVLRYDDRGVGASTGDFDAATTADFAQDAKGAVRYLRSQTNVNVGTIGVLGHSEGGVVAPMVADEEPGIGFVVMLAGTGVNGARVSLSQRRAIMMADGASEEEIEADQALTGKLLDCYPPNTSATLGDTDPTETCMRSALEQAGASAEDEDATVSELLTPWNQFFMTYDPAPVLRRVRAPVLALNGSLDLQVLASENLPVIRALLLQAGNPYSTTVELPGLNHLFQHATTGSPSEYGRISETMAPELLSRVARWIEDLPHSTKH